MERPAKRPAAIVYVDPDGKMQTVTGVATEATVKYLIERLADDTRAAANQAAQP